MDTKVEPSSEGRWPASRLWYDDGAAESTPAAVFPPGVARLTEWVLEFALLQC